MREYSAQGSENIQGIAKWNGHTNVLVRLTYVNYAINSVHAEPFRDGWILRCIDPINCGCMIETLPSLEWPALSACGDP